MLWICCVLVLLFVISEAVAQGWSCPAVCECKWRNGKITAECSNKNLKLIPEGINPQTQVLDLSGNNLGNISDFIFQKNALLNVQKLYLQRSKVTKLGPFSLKGLTNLIELDLSGNLLASIPTAAFLEIYNLRVLSLRNNPIHEVKHFAFTGIATVIYIDLSECMVSWIGDDAFRGLQKLETLNLANNKLSDLSESTVISIQHLYNIQLHNNPWNCDCGLLALKSWLLEYNIPYPEDPTCNSPVSLKGQKLGSLNITQFACPPQMLPTPRKMWLYVGDSGKFECKVNSVPASSIAWSYQHMEIHNKSKLNSNEMVVFEYGEESKISSLEIKKVNKFHAGNFTCTVKNPAATITANFTLVVNVRYSAISHFTAGMSVFFIVFIIIIIIIILYLLFRIRNSSSSKTAMAESADSQFTIYVRPMTYVQKTRSTGTNSSPELLSGSPKNPDLVNDLAISSTEHRPSSLQYGKAKDADKEEFEDIDAVVASLYINPTCEMLTEDQTSSPINTSHSTD